MRRDQQTPPRRGLARPRVRRSWFPAYCFVLLAFTSVVTVIEPRVMHWFLLPVLACGLLIGKDAMDWLTGRLDTFDPKGIIGILGIHLFVLAPILIVLWDMDYDVAQRPDDWRPWLGRMAIVNAIGLALYLGVSKLAFQHVRFRQKIWRIAHDRTFAILVLALAITGLAQAYLWFRFGGISGQIRAYKGTDAGSTSGLFRYQLLATAFPILLLIALTYLRSRRRPSTGKYSAAFIVLTAIFVLYFITDGLRGSRGATVFTLFWAAGIIHYFWRRLDARVILLAMIPLFLFMYLYGLYKSYGDQVFTEYQDSGSISELTARSGRTVRRMTISDLSRSDVQAFMLYRLTTAPSEYQLTWGATYAEAPARLLIPASLWSGRPRVPRKSLAGAELHYGQGASMASPELRFSKVYGLAGEAMLNFSIYGVPIAFALFGLVMGVYRRYQASFPDRDARLLIAPFVANGFLIALLGDFDNILVFILSKGIVPLLVLLLIVKRRTA